MCVCDRDTIGAPSIFKVIRSVVSLGIILSIFDLSWVARFYFMGCVKEVSNLFNHPIVSLLVNRVGSTRVKVITKRVYLKLPVTTTRWDLVVMVVGKNPGLISLMRPPNQIIGLKKRTHLGTSSSWDSRPVISARRTEYSMTVTMCCRERKDNCSVRRDFYNR